MRTLEDVLQCEHHSEGEDDFFRRANSQTQVTEDIAYSSGINYIDPWTLASGGITGCSASVYTGETLLNHFAPDRVPAPSMAPYFTQYPTADAVVESVADTVSVHSVQEEASLQLAPPDCIMRKPRALRMHTSDESSSSALSLTQYEQVLEVYKIAAGSADAEATLQCCDPCYDSSTYSCLEVIVMFVGIALGLVLEQFIPYLFSTPTMLLSAAAASRNASRNVAVAVQFALYSTAGVTTSCIQALLGRCVALSKGTANGLSLVLDLLVAITNLFGTVCATVRFFQGFPQQTPSPVQRAAAVPLAFWNSVILAQAIKL